MTEAALDAHRSTAGTIAGASGALLVLTLIGALLVYLSYGRKIRRRPAPGLGNHKHSQAEAKRALVATLALAAALFVLFVTTTAIGSTGVAQPTRANTSAQTNTPEIRQPTPVQQYSSSQPGKAHVEQTSLGIDPAGPSGLPAVPTSR